MRKLIDRAAEAGYAAGWWHPDVRLRNPWSALNKDQRDVMRSAALAVARVLLEEPASDDMATAAREALRTGGLLPAYTDDAKNGQTPILHFILKETALNAASVTRLAELDRVWRALMETRTAATDHPPATGSAATAAQGPQTEPQNPLKDIP